MKIISRLLLILVMACMIIFVPANKAEAIQGESSQGAIVKLTGDIYVNEGSTVQGDVVTINGNIYINGDVTGNAVSVFGDIIINGKVLGDAVTVSGKITVGEKGKILGNTVEAVKGSVDARRSYDSNNYKPSITPWGWGANLLFSFFGTVAFFFLTALIYLIMPRKIEEMADSIDESIGRKIGIGLLTIIGSPIIMIILTVILAITLIGIIVIPFAWIAYAIAFVVSAVPVYLYIGKRAGASILRQNLLSYRALAAGVFTLWLINTVASIGGTFTGWIGWLVTFMIYVIGVGTLLEYIFSSKKRKPDYYQYSAYPPQGGGYSPYNQPPQDFNYVPQEKASKNEGSSEDIKQDGRE